MVTCFFKTKRSPKECLRPHPTYEPLHVFQQQLLNASVRVIDGMTELL